jgi:NADH pyrophosphatase NudC (nudix superfamily)
LSLTNPLPTKTNIIQATPMTETAYQYCPLCRSALVGRELGGRARRACPREGCGFVAWDNPVPVVAAIVERDGEVILVRSRGRPDTWYGLVAGFLEKDEHPEAAVLREIQEEIGLAVRELKFLGIYTFELRNQIIFVYHALAEPGAIRLCEEELASYKSVLIERLRPWPLGTGPALRDWLAARGYHPPVMEFGTHIVR